MLKGTSRGEKERVDFIDRSGVRRYFWGNSPVRLGLGGQNHHAAG